ncbi:S-layer homology domain-containing protein [Angustibacter sp. Root456]|uniref:S-layer homology domain-containing protein n=1 Tax=Angustibacter sp. Root456 TaxID=1736539 RepID=UPI00138F31D9|nr:S-layer homology domain-containing protein [Angustibacter sp. Root456]
MDAPRAAPVKLPPAPVVAPTPSAPPVPPVVEQPPAPSVPAFSAAAVPSDVHAKLVEYASKGLLAYDGNDTFRPEQMITRIDFATVLVDVLDLSPPETVTGSYSDVPTEAFAGPAIDAMTKAGLIKGIDGSRFAPAATINRSELAVLLAKGLNLPSAPPAQPTFTDVPTVNYAYAAIESVAQAGLMSGLSDGEFRPDKAVTRAQLAVTLVRALSLPVDDTVTSPFVDVPDDSYSSLYVVAAVSAGLLRPVDATHFDPTGGVSRAVAALLFTKGLGLPVPSTTSSPFADVTSQYYAGQAIEAVVDAGLMKPASSDVFNPATVLTLPQESTLFDGAMKFAAAGMPAPDPAP